MKNLLTKVLYAVAFCFVICQSTIAQQQKSSTTALDYGYGPSDAPTVTVRTQSWLGKNLNVDHFANGDTIPEAKTEEEWKLAGKNKQPAWCFYKNDPANGRIYGRLYNWFAVKDPRGLAPRGWHIPSAEEWEAMEGRDGNAGLSMKSTSGWNENGNGNNSSGFDGLPGGSRSNVGIFDEVGSIACWWSSTEYGYGTNAAKYRYLIRGNTGLNGSMDTYEKGFSIRCIKD